MYRLITTRERGNGEKEGKLRCFFMNKEEKERLFNEIFSTFRRAYSEGYVPATFSESERHWRISCRRYDLDPEDKVLFREYVDYSIKRLLELTKIF